MVIGTGMIAKRFMEYAQNDAFVIFAAGVANSREINPVEFQREENLLLETLKNNPNKFFVYFGSSVVYDPQTKDLPYTHHKLKMENLIQQKSNSYLIFRLSQVVGRSNNKTQLMNFLVDAVLNGKEFSIWENAYRNFIGVDEVYSIVNAILSRKLYQNKIVNVANTQSVSVRETVGTIEKFFKKRSIAKSENKGHRYNIDTKDILPIIEDLKIPFNANYVQHLLEQYYL